MILRTWFMVVLLLLTSSAAFSGEREDYLLCVTDELGRGADLSAIGKTCLEQARPDAEPHEDKEKPEDYPYESTLREIMATEGSLRDTESARLKDLVHSNIHNAWCGQINATNGFGGYVGWEYFALRDRYRGHGRRSDHIDFKVGVKEFVEGTCKSYRAWRRELW